MSHSSGISISKALIDGFKTLNEGHGRFIKASIEEDQIVPKYTEQGTSDFEGDLDLVLNQLVDAEPCYILFRTEEKDDLSNGYKWLLLSYIPDKSKVRMKMLYSSTKAIFRQTLGGNVFSSEIHGTVKADFGKSGYEAYLKHEAAAPPLTEQEEEREKEIELGTAGYTVSTGMATVTASNGVAFPVEDAVTEAVKKMCDSGNNFVEIGIDIDNEKIVLRNETQATIEDVEKLISKELPSFIFFRWDHTHEDKEFKSIIYIFSCPDGSHGTKSAPVRQRMLYSTSKGAVENVLTQNNAEVTLKVEINSPDDFKVDEIKDKIHPPPVEEKKMFAKPKPKFARKK
ncbi:twinfilin-1, putative [Entamoeba invadens IP1]|uniref:Twinfilin n=2 Tax=Entamoeba invadens TaxID=33085 RepID=A0A0A1TVX1_ENTIV|nr:twinfilin-1, putative [Entamoeba invadens IP1]ELP84591.1 twinfilin-1, putative [Entamoeba invadens IP1]BAN40702.1 twinfilin-1, putative [Entamoeba invadens]|eukprot:XP_004183937.1 twinfilin-1, putative [Entamoeba invadens IP1]